MNLRDRYDSLFQYYGAQAGVDWRLLKAQALAESGLDPDARSPVGATGLAQFMAATWQEWADGKPGIAAGPSALPGVNPVLLDPRDPEDAIRAQAAYMAWLLGMFEGDTTSALAAYNWGVGRVRAERRGDTNWLTRAPRETRDYVARVLAGYQVDRR